MLTRSKSKKINQQLKNSRNSNNIMSASNESSIDSEVEVNNQLGLRHIFSEETRNGTTLVEKEAEGLRNNNNAGSEAPPQPGSNMDIMDMLRQMATQMNENNKTIEDKLAENAKQVQESHKELENKLTAKIVESIHQVNESIRNVNREIRVELERQIQEVRTENHQHLHQIREEVKDIARGEFDVVRTELNGHLEEIDRVVKRSESVVTQEVENINRRLESNNKKRDEKLKQTKAEILQKLKEVKESSEGTAKSLEERYDQSLEQVDGRIRQIREDVRTKIDQVGLCTGKLVPNDYIKNVVFNGEGDYPMEFVKDLEEIEHEWYRDSNINWITRHLVGGAAVWWRIVKGNITTFNEFKEAFSEKYWNHMIQEEVRDRLEFGRYRRDSNLTMAQYMERCVLQNRQLIPPLSDEHLIRKLGRHFSREIQVALLTRNVNNISKFQSVLIEFAQLRSQVRERTVIPEELIKQEQRVEKGTSPQWSRRKEARQQVDIADTQERAGQQKQQRQREREDTRPVYRKTYAAEQVEVDPVPGPSGVQQWYKGGQSTQTDSKN